MCLKCMKIFSLLLFGFEQSKGGCNCIWSDFFRSLELLPLSIFCCWILASPSWKMSITVPCSCNWSSCVSPCQSVLSIAKKIFLKSVMQEGINTPLLSCTFFLTAFCNILLDTRYVIKSIDQNFTSRLW